MKEIMIAIYLFIFKIFFSLFKLLPLKNKVTFLISFPENPVFIYKQMKLQKINAKPIFLCHLRCYDRFAKTNELTYLFETKNILHTVKGFYHLATSAHVIADNYYGCLAVIKFKKEVQCLQIWHAVGAIKQFGIYDPANKFRHPKAIQRFKNVYAKFDKIIVGSDKMGSIFKKAYLKDEDSILKIGIPRTDFFFRKEQLQHVKNSFYQTNPIFKTKKIILYAPTFRNNAGLGVDTALDIPLIYESLNGQYILILKFHPSTTHINFSSKYSNFVYDYSNYPTINELLAITDILITDYSSLPMEFSLLKRKMIFFAYDLEEYKNSSGFWEDYEASVPGPIVKNTTELIDTILNQQVNIRQLETYAKKWTNYCDGNSSSRFVRTLLETKIPSKFF